MPTKPARPCRKPGCPALTNDKSGYCEQHARAAQQAYDNERGTANDRGYNYRWQQVSRLFLQAHPLCAICQQQTPPAITAATLVDHIIPHKGDSRLFWDESNWQPLCKPCHDVKTAAEDGGFGNQRSAG